MTTRNFRVNNGLEVGDIVISASANTITGGATAAPSADGQFANKKYVDDQAAAALTLTNKTLTAPKIADAGFIADANGNESVIFQTTTSAVNELEITNAATGNGPILGASGETNVDLNITAKGTGNILLNAGSDVVIPANKGLQFVDANEKIESDGTDLTINSGAKINLTATSDVAIPANIGITFGTHEKIESDDTDLTITVGANGDVNLGADIGLTFGDDGEKIEGNGTKLTIASSDAIDLTATTDVVIPANVGLTFGTGEKIEGDSTDLTVTSGGAINLTATTDVVVPANVGITFGTGEKIEGDSTDLTVTSGGAINLTATTDVVIPANVGITFGTGEKIEGDSTDLTVTSGAKINLAATSDVHVPQNVGIVFDANGSEKIESNDTDLTINSGAKINLTAVSDVHIPQNIGLVFDANGTEKIESNDTDLTINSGAKINLTAVSDVHIPKNIGIVFDDNASEKIESNDTDLTINSGADINLTATADVNLPNNIGLVFGDDGEKIEGDGTNLTIASSGLCTITATGETVVTNNLRIGGNLTVDGTETIVNTTTLSIEDNIIEVNRNVSANSGMPTVSGLQINRGEGSTATEMPLLWAWDEAFADDGTTIHGNAGGAFTAFRRAEGNTEGPSGTASLVDIRANVVHAVATSAQYADVAERFEADAPMSAGAVVMVGGDAEITETTSDLSDQVFGVISEQPAYAMNAAAGNNDTHPYVAMTGRTPVRVTGAVTKGQRLVTSSVKGCARAVASGESISPFNVIGRALESSTDAGIKLVNCAVRPNN